MGFRDWTTNLFTKNKDGTLSLSDAFAELGVDAFYKRLAVETCIDLIANSIILCEFQTFEKGKESRGENYYLFNVAPNQNQNASEFIHSMITHLFMDNECLVIMQNDKLYVADDYAIKHSSLYENIYSSVTVGDFTFDRTFVESEVVYLKLNDKNIMEVINGLYSSYGKLLSSAMNYYKRKNNKRLLVKGNFSRSQTDEVQKAIDEMFSRQLTDYFNADKEGTAFQVPKDFEIDDRSDSITGANSSTSRDINDLVNDIFNMIATAFHVPVGLLRGNLADVEKQTNNYLMFCVNPLVKLISTEFNRKFFTKTQYLERTYLKVDTTQIKIVDVVAMAGALDKLFAIGVNNTNDNRRILGREPITEEWADKYFITKNYQSVESLENQSEGGEGGNE